MSLENLKIGFALTGSFCTIERVVEQLHSLVLSGADVLPIFSECVNSTDTRFGNHTELYNRVKQITGHDVMTNIKSAEPIGPKNLLDALIIAPCTGNTLGKLANGITDSSVTMAAKATLRNKKPVIIAVSTNDGLSNSAKNIGTLLNVKNIYFVPFGQDDPVNKETSLVAKMEYILPTLNSALDGRQIQPILR